MPDAQNISDTARIQFQYYIPIPNSLLRDVSPMVDQENNVLQYFLSSDLVSLGLWGNLSLIHI